MAHSQSSDEPNLFDVGRKPTKRRTPAAAPQVIHHLIGVYRALYESRFHEPPVVLKRDGAILKSLVLQFGPEKVEQRLRAYLQWDDAFVVGSGYALTLFQSCWNRLAALCVSQSSPRADDDGLARTQRYLNGIRAVSGRRATGT